MKKKLKLVLIIIILSSSQSKGQSDNGFIGYTVPHQSSNSRIDSIVLSKYKNVKLNKVRSYINAQMETLSSNGNFDKKGIVHIADDRIKFNIHEVDFEVNFGFNNSFSIKFYCRNKSLCVSVSGEEYSKTTGCGFSLTFRKKPYHDNIEDDIEFTKDLAIVEDLAAAFKYFQQTDKKYN